MPPSKEQLGWVERVLGVRAEPQPAPRPNLKATLTAVTEKAGKLAAAPRPQAPARQQTTNRLLGAMAAKPAPETLEDTPAHVAEFLPGFLVSMETERPVASQKLEAGAPVSGPDQLLGIADLFAAAQRAMIEWETLLDQAEAADDAVDGLEEQAEERDEEEYTDSLTAYNAHRKQSIAAEARAMKLMAELQAKFNSLSESAQAAALKETADA